MCRFLIKLENPHFDPKTSKIFYKTLAPPIFQLDDTLALCKKSENFQKKTLDINKTRIQKTYKLMDKQADGLIDKQKN